MIADHLLHALAWAALRTQPPLRAKRLVDWAARTMSPLSNEREASTMASSLRGGTCLSRAVTVAARLRSSEVVIGVALRGDSVAGHAWVEVHGRPLEGEVVRGEVMTRLGRAGPGRAFG